MEFINKIATFMHTADRAFWHGKMETNRYFATVSVLFALLAGIVTTGHTSGILEWLVFSFLKWNIYPSLKAAIGMLIVLIVLNVCESIFGAKSFASGLLRSIWVTIAISIAFILGVNVYMVMTIVLLLLTMTLLISVVAITVKNLRIIIKN